MDYQKQETINFYAIWTMGIITFICVLWLSITAITADHRIRYYYLGETKTANLTLCADIDWAIDDKINLNGVTYERAVQLVDSLNKTIK